MKILLQAVLMEVPVTSQTVLLQSRAPNKIIPVEVRPMNNRLRDRRRVRVHIGPESHKKPIGPTHPSMLKILATAMAGASAELRESEAQ